MLSDNELLATKTFMVIEDDDELKFNSESQESNKTQEIEFQEANKIEPINNKLNTEELISNNEVRLSGTNFALQEQSNMIESENKITKDDDSALEIEVENKSVVEEIKNDFEEKNTENDQSEFINKTITEELNTFLTNLESKLKNNYQNSDLFYLNEPSKLNNLKNAIENIIKNEIREIESQLNVDMSGVESSEIKEEVRTEVIKGEDKIDSNAENEFNDEDVISYVTSVIAENLLENTLIQKPDEIKEEKDEDTVNFRHSKDKMAETLVQDMMQENDQFLVNIRRLSKYVSRMKSSAVCGLKIDNQEKSGEDSKSIRKFIASNLDFCQNVKTDDINIDIDLEVSNKPNQLEHLNKGRPKPKRTKNTNNPNKIVAIERDYSELKNEQIEEKKNSLILNTTNDTKKAIIRNSVNQPKIDMKDLKNFKFRNQKGINSIDEIETELEDKKNDKTEEEIISKPPPEPPINTNMSVKKNQSENNKSIKKHTEDVKIDTEKKTDKKNCLIC